MRGEKAKSYIAASILGALLLFLPQQSQAAVPRAIQNDLKPVSGYIVMVVDNQYIIDLDASTGLQLGDILAVVRPGKKIVHPVTKKILGEIEETVAVLKVTRLQEGHSFAKPVRKAEAAHTNVCHHRDKLFSVLRSV